MKYIRDEKAIKALGKKIKSIRTEQNISQRQLAYEAGIQETQVRRVEKGQINTSISTIFAIASALNVAPAKLFE